MVNWKFALLAAAATITAAWAAADEPGGPFEPLRTPPGKLIIEEELWTDLADEPGNHMDRARTAYIGVDAGVAATELRKAATHLRISAAEAADGSKRALLRSAQELESLARRVEAGTVKSAAELDAAFARALHALAHHHCVLAERSWADRQTRVAGKRMRAAADNMERAAARTGRALQSATREVAKDTRIISGKLIEGVGFVVDEVGKGFTTLGRQVENVGHGIEPHPPQAAKGATPPNG